MKVQYFLPPNILKEITSKKSRVRWPGADRLCGQVPPTDHVPADTHLSGKQAQIIMMRFGQVFPAPRSLNDIRVPGQARQEVGSVTENTQAMALAIGSKPATSSSYRSHHCR